MVEAVAQAIETKIAPPLPKASRQKALEEPGIAANDNAMLLRIIADRVGNAQSFINAIMANPNLSGLQLVLSDPGISELALADNTVAILRSMVEGTMTLKQTEQVVIASKNNPSAVAEKLEEIRAVNEATAKQIETPTASKAEVSAESPARKEAEATVRVAFYEREITGAQQEALLKVAKATPEAVEPTLEQVQAKNSEAAAKIVPPANLQEFAGAAGEGAAPLPAGASKSYLKQLLDQQQNPEAGRGGAGLTRGGSTPNN